MSFFRSGAPPAASYNRILDGSDSNNSSPQGRSGHGHAFSPTHTPTRKAPPRSGGRHVLVTIDICFND